MFAYSSTYFILELCYCTYVSGWLGVSVPWFVFKEGEISRFCSFCNQRGAQDFWNRVPTSCM